VLSYYNSTLITLICKACKKLESIYIQITEGSERKTNQIQKWDALFFFLSFWCCIRQWTSWRRILSSPKLC